MTLEADIDNALATYTSLTGKHALITGASRGLGRAIAESFLTTGARVLLVARDPDTLAQSAGEMAGSGEVAGTLAVDLAEPASADAIASAVSSDLGGRLDILVANAGGPQGIAGGIGDLSFEDWSRAFQVNLDSVFHTISACLPSMQSGGSIVTVSSVSGVRGDQRFVAYASAKAALLGLTQSMALVLARQGIRINCLIPGLIPTQARGDEDQHALWASRIPRGRLGDAEDTAAAALFMASEASAYMTGQTLAVDGGTLAGSYAPAGLGIG